VGLLFEPGDESACSLQCHVEIVDAEEQEEAVARRRLVRAHQGGMLVRAPLVEAEQDGSIRIQDLTKVVMARRRLGLAEERLVPFEATGNVADADDRPRAFHRSSAVGLTTGLLGDAMVGCLLLCMGFFFKFCTLGVVKRFRTDIQEMALGIIKANEGAIDSTPALPVWLADGF
jgi:hypothetical protein